MIGKVGKRGAHADGLLRYLFGPGTANQHVRPRLVASWCGDTAHLEPPADGDGRRDVTRLANLLSVPLCLVRGKVPDKPVYHVAVRAASTDREITDAEWQDISTEVMHRLGLSERGDEENGVRWVAVTHGDNHIHIVCVLARMNGQRINLFRDWCRVGQTMAWAEKKYGLAVVPRGSQSRSKATSPTRAEMEKAAREGRDRPARTELRDLIEEAASAASGDSEFFAALAARNVQVRFRYSPVSPGQVTGYAAGLPDDVSAAGAQVWYSGGSIDRNLTLPRLRARWAPGRQMNSADAKAAVHRKVTAAAAARTEEAFFRDLASAGLDVHLWYDPADPGRVTRYSAGLAGQVGPEGRPVRYSATALDPALTLGRLRARWQKGLPGVPAPADPGQDGDGR